MSAMKKGKKGAKMGPWPRLQKFWDIRAACNFIGGGTGSGLLMIAAFLALFGVVNDALIIAGIVFVCFGLFMVFLEIGRPWRSINLFFHPQTSWMTREGILVAPLFLSACLVIYFDGQTAGKVSAVFMGLLSAGYLYCQLRMLHAAKGIPAWRHPSLMPYIFISGITEAFGVAICLPGLNKVQELWLALCLMLVVRLVFWTVYTRNLKRDGAPEASCKVFDKIYIKIQFAHLIPIALLIAAWNSEALIFSMTAGLIAAVTGWVIKSVIVTRAAQTNGFAIPRTPVRGQGKSRLIGQQR